GAFEPRQVGPREVVLDDRRVTHRGFREAGRACGGCTDDTERRLRWKRARAPSRKHPGIGVRYALGGEPLQVPQPRLVRGERRLVGVFIATDSAATVFRCAAKGLEVSLIPRLEVLRRREAIELELN